MNAEISVKNQTVLLETVDLSPSIDNKVLLSMGQHVCSVTEEDLDSRRGWEEANEEWLKLATQVREEKNYPWPGASNVKFPLLSTTALQFHARAYPALIPEGQLVKMRVFGSDPMNKKYERAQRVSKHMSWQLIEENKGWQEDMDRLLYILPIIGLCYKKTYYSPLKGYNESILVLPDDLIINYYAEDYERAIKTHRIYQDENEIYELQAIGHYREVDLPKDNGPQKHEGVEDDIIGLTAPDRSQGVDSAFNDVPHTILEQHTWWDLDGDGYKEPYIITVDQESQTVLRVSARWVPQAIQSMGEKIARIIPTEYFTAFGFLPNPESKIYYQGFGQLLGPLNAASNTILNQLLDSGHLNNLPGGFLGKGIRIRGGKLKFKPGEWKVLQSTGSDIKSNVVPLPVKEPSSVLFSLLGMLIEAGERLGSVKDIMVGESPGQNQPYATTLAVLKEGMKVFVGIYKRLYRSLTAEYKRLYSLNQIYFNQEQYFMLLDQESEQVSEEDYSTADLDIVPNADPNLVSEAQKMMKTESLLQKMAAGMPLNVEEVTRRTLEAENHENMEALMRPNPPQEDPELTFKRETQQANLQLEYAKLQSDNATSQYKAFKDYAMAMSAMAKAAAAEQGMELSILTELSKAASDEYKAVTERLKAVQDGLLKAGELDTKSTEEEDTQLENDI